MYISVCTKLNQMNFDKAFGNWWIVTKLKLVIRKDQFYFAFSKIMYMY